MVSHYLTSKTRQTLVDGPRYSPIGDKNTDYLPNLFVCYRCGELKDTCERAAPSRYCYDCKRHMDVVGGLELED